MSPSLVSRLLLMNSIIMQELCVLDFNPSSNPMASDCLDAKLLNMLAQIDARIDRHHMSATTNTCSR